jgi:adenosylhomocysteine nucleosidase
MREGKEHVGLVAALPQECRGVLSWPGWRKSKEGGEIRILELETEGRLLRLAISGMGRRRALKALDELLDGVSPSWVISFGFAGALDSSLRVGDVLRVARVLGWSGPGQLLEGPPLYEPPGVTWLETATMVSVPGFVSKGEVRRDLRGDLGPCLLDLESLALAEEALARGVRLLGVRAVSDELGLDLGPQVARWVDEDLRVRTSRLLLSTLKRPGDLLLMSRLWARSRVASRALGRELARLLAVPYHGPGPGASG